MSFRSMRESRPFLGVPSAQEVHNLSNLLLHRILRALRKHQEKIEGFAGTASDFVEGAKEKLFSTCERMCRGSPSLSLECIVLLYLLYKLRQISWVAATLQHLKSAAVSAPQMLDEAQTLSERHRLLELCRLDEQSLRQSGH